MADPLDVLLLLHLAGRSAYLADPLDVLLRLLLHLAGRSASFSVPVRRPRRRVVLVAAAAPLRHTPMIAGCRALQPSCSSFQPSAASCRRRRFSFLFYSTRDPCAQQSCGIHSQQLRAVS